MAKKNKHHKDFRKIKVILTDGESFHIMSTYHKEEYRADIDVKTHQAWRGGVTQANERNTSVQQFAKRFGTTKFLSGMANTGSSSEPS